MRTTRRNAGTPRHGRSRRFDRRRNATGGDATNFLPAVLRRLHPFIHVRCHHTHCRSMSLVADTLSLHVVTHTVSQKRHSSPARVRNPREAATTAKGVSPTLLASAASAGVDGAISAVRYVGRGAAADAGRSGGLGESALRGVARPLQPPPVQTSARFIACIVAG